MWFEQDDKAVLNEEFIKKSRDKLFIYLEDFETNEFEFIESVGLVGRYYGIHTPNLFFGAFRIDDNEFSIPYDWMDKI